jgi:hypothetical protein
MDQSSIWLLREVRRLLPALEARIPADVNFEKSRQKEI